MNRYLIRNLIYPLHEFLKGKDTFARLKELEKTQYLGRAELRKIQFEKLRRLLEHSYANVPYYRQLFDQLGVKPGDIRTLDDLPAIPFLGKEIIRRNYSELVARGYRGRRIEYTTGGSTGEPMKFLVDPGRTSSEWAANWRARRWWDVDIGDRNVTLWGSPIELSTQDRIKTLRDRLLNTRLLSSFQMDERNMEDYVRFLNRFRPVYLFAYSSAMVVLAEFIRRRFGSARDMGIRAIFTTADTLYDHQRKAIEEVFECPVGLEYGARDGGLIAHDCPKKNLHLSSEGLIVEIVRDGKPVDPGERGEIVLTNLDAFLFPFIRYRIGDVGVLSDKECDCGVRLPIIESLQGRSTDFLVAPGGKLIHGEAATHIMRSQNGIKQFLAIQEAEDEIQIKLVVDSKFQSIQTKVIESQMKRLLSQEVKVSIVFVDRIKPTSSGKYRYVVSRVANAYFSRG